MTIHYPVGLQSRFNTHRIVDAKGQIIARTEMGPATAVGLRDALNAHARRQATAVEIMESQASTLMEMLEGRGLLDRLPHELWGEVHCEIVDLLGK